MMLLQCSGDNVELIFFFFLRGGSQEQLPELHMHFQAQSFHTSMYASSWFLTIFLTSFPLPVATRIFDIFMCEVSQREPPRPKSFWLLKTVPL